MRIRRRPQAQALPTLQPSSESSTAPQPPPNAPRNQQQWLLSVSGDKKLEEDGKKKKLEELHLHPNADLGDEPLAALPLLQPQGNVVGVGCSEGPGGGAQQRRAAAADGHRSLENGHRDKSELPVTNAGGRIVNGVPAMPVATTVTVNLKEEIKNDSGRGGAKKRRGPAVLMEGSRCSRVNGRGWRCSQPTLVGYSLCEHHLGKGRMRSSASGGGRGGAAQLGRTEPNRKSAAAVAVAVVTAAPAKANDLPSVRHS